MSTDESLSKLRENIDFMTFEQILEMDDEDDHEFSSSIVFGFFEQAENTFQSMDQALESKDLAQLSSLGHFLKGSSATIGMFKVKDSCEAIQHFGASKNEKGEPEPDKDDAYWVAKIATTMKVLKKDYEAAETDLKSYYEAADSGK